jgi:hypothetical protein
MVAVHRHRHAAALERALDLGDGAIGEPAVEVAATLLGEQVERRRPGRRRAQKSSMIWR